MYFYCTFEFNKTRILSMLGTGYFLKTQKSIPSKKNQFVLVAKISSRKTQKKSLIRKINSRNNFVPHGRPHGVLIVPDRRVTRQHEPSNIHSLTKLAKNGLHEKQNVGSLRRVIRLRPGHAFSIAGSSS